MIIRAGNFTLMVGDAYPVNCTLTTPNKSINFNHRELADLVYVAERAMREARVKLRQAKCDPDEV